MQKKNDNQNAKATGNAENPTNGGSANQQPKKDPILKKLKEMQVQLNEVATIKTQLNKAKEDEGPETASAAEV